MTDIIDTSCDIGKPVSAVRTRDMVHKQQKLLRILQDIDHIEVNPVLTCTGKSIWPMKREEEIQTEEYSQYFLE